MKALVPLLLLAACACTFAISQEQQRHGKSEKSTAAPCPDTLAWTGKYINHSFGFSVVIPKELKGFWNSARCVAGSDGCTCMSDHGRIIPLTEEPCEPDRHLEVHAGYTADLDEPTVKQEVGQHLEWIRERSREGSVDVLKESSLPLAGLKAQRVVARYNDKKLNRLMVEDFIEILRAGVEYSLYLRTNDKAYDQDRKVFDNVIASFAVRKGRRLHNLQDSAARR